MPFTAFFPAGVADPHLIARLTRQRVLQGLLRGAVGGLQQVMRRGKFTIPPSVAAATQRFKMESDPLRAYMEERVSFHHAHDPVFTPRADLYGGYTAWAAINGFHQMSAQRFYESFTAAAVDTSEHPVVMVKRDGVYGYRGLSIR